ncbi:hypothetical protein K9U39_08435 [Rhodoblastus acidophilus]|uniref:Restriction endonuclease n=1 Tax=Candidatus Rhodoblastus alkanivorans TaxID=2954117 RepID=A0ABS9Z8Y4_9HYPH|nr:hypothetical protein [Candidatus Rhodoblastus alkanivorans]MCI4679621.1 hypothetical protein [Candidatus Rhodoblastus alkanivorans]MCI4683657.1 hypothetical protein [Candidatus Rhodoblastus alkanivorans]MDI4640973.1 hypothetical protein [Rhodoblastus acidophilus]
MAKSLKKTGEASQEKKENVRIALEDALKLVEVYFINGAPLPHGLSSQMTSSLDVLNANADKASSGFTNIITCLAIKSAQPDIDVRYHQMQIQKDITNGAGFNFRGVSEDIVYPWLDKQSFSGAKSGWQTRTFERPKPYMLSYEENIGAIKHDFLNVFDRLETHGEQANEALAYLLYRQLEAREKKKLALFIPKTRDVGVITALLQDHVFYQYKNSKGASRLPVLAIYAIYLEMMDELSRYKGKTLKPLMEHSAADSQTGAIGDIEISSADTIFEAIEIKHGIPLSAGLVRDASKKIGGLHSSVDRYYILTTSASCQPDAETLAAIENVKARLSCEIIANGVIPSIRYYLRLLKDPSNVFLHYVRLLAEDKAIAHVL